MKILERITPALSAVVVLAAACSGGSNVKPRLESLDGGLPTAIGDVADTFLEAGPADLGAEELWQEPCGGCPEGFVCDEKTGQCRCVPNCSGKACGDDGCGGSCGECEEGYECADGTCVCVPQCDGLECGDDGCGGSCGECEEGYECADGTCVCIPQCDGLECGDDGCGGSCGECEEGYECADGTCVCIPQCDGLECGDDGCGGSCGECDPEWVCVNGKCELFCPESECEEGSTICIDEHSYVTCIALPGLCPDVFVWSSEVEECPEGWVCSEGICQCYPDCTGLECGDDGCGGSCGECDPEWVCVNGKCELFCPESECEEGSTICVDEHSYVTCIALPGLCPDVFVWSSEVEECPEGWVCSEGICQCYPDCTGLECGDDGCGGSCGECPEDKPFCIEGVCSAICIPNCAGKECGDDGCGGQCGECDADSICINGKCEPFCPESECEEGSTTCIDEDSYVTCVALSAVCPNVFVWSTEVEDCPDGWVCSEGTCQCYPDCTGLECGDDGCGGSCGDCPEDKPFCVDGVCSAICIPNCTGKECGDDGCGGSCGTCQPGYECVPTDVGTACKINCAKQCAGFACGTAGPQGECDCGSCDDGNPCTDDICTDEHLCAYLPNTLPCNDSDPCTGPGVCKDGVCIPGAPIICDDHNECTTDICVPGVGCKFTPDDSASCSDGNACNGVETCVGGVCVPGKIPDCDDNNPCTEDSCDPAEGCVHSPLSGIPCSDGDVCNGEDVCEAGECVGSTQLTCEDNNPCTDDSCDPVKGCVFTPDDTNICLDSDLCNGSEKCVGGECVPGEPLVCTDANPCTTDACEPEVGCVYSPLPDGTSCPGGPNYSCLGGECVCVPDCTEKECGPDGCGGICGECAEGESCINGKCGAPYTCAEIVGCAMKCLFSPDCLFGCREQGDEEAKALFDALAICIANECGVAPSLACIGKAIAYVPPFFVGPCRPQYDMCMDDKKND